MDCPEREMQESQANEHVEEMNYEILVDSAQALRGDQVSVEIIYANLTGMNFQPERRAAWQTGTYEQYLAFMSAEFGTQVVDGSVISCGIIGREPTQRWTVRLGKPLASASS